MPPLRISVSYFIHKKCEIGQNNWLTLSLRFEPHISISVGHRHQHSSLFLSNEYTPPPSKIYSLSLYLFTFISFQTCMTFFLLWNIEDYILGNVPVFFSVWWQPVQQKLLGNTSYYFVHVLFNFFYWHKDDLHYFLGFLTLQFTI